MLSDRDYSDMPDDVRSSNSDSPATTLSLSLREEGPRASPAPPLRPPGSTDRDVIREADRWGGDPDNCPHTLVSDRDVESPHAAAADPIRPPPPLSPTTPLDASTPQQPQPHARAPHAKQLSPRDKSLEHAESPSAATLPCCGDPRGDETAAPHPPAEPEPPIAAAREALARHLDHHRALSDTRRGGSTTDAWRSRLDSQRPQQQPQRSDCASDGAAGGGFVSVRGPHLVSQDGGNGKSHGAGSGLSSRPGEEPGSGPARDAGDNANRHGSRPPTLGSSLSALRGAVTGLLLPPLRSRPPAALGQRYQGLLPPLPGSPEGRDTAAGAEAAGVVSVGEERTAPNPDTGKREDMGAALPPVFLPSPSRATDQTRGQDRPATRNASPEKGAGPATSAVPPVPGSSRVPRPPGFIPSNGKQQPTSATPSTQVPSPSATGSRSQQQQNDDVVTARLQGASVLQSGWAGAGGLLRLILGNYGRGPRGQRSSSKQVTPSGASSGTADNPRTSVGLQTGGTGVQEPSLESAAAAGGQRDGPILTTDHAHEALTRLEATAAEQAGLAGQLEEWAEDHPVAHVAAQLMVVRIQMHRPSQPSSLFGARRSS